MKAKKKARELKLEKLRLQNQMLGAQLAPKRKPAFFEKYVNAPAKQYSTLILTLLSVVGGIWGVFLPIKKFLNEQQRTAQYQLNSQIISLVRDLDDSTKNQATTIAILTYYERDAIPVLIHELGQRTYSEKMSIVEALNTIKILRDQTTSESLIAGFFGEENVNSLLGKTLINQTRSHFKRAFEKPNEQKYNDLNAMLNYIFAIGELSRRNMDASQFLENELLNKILLDSVNSATDTDQRLAFTLGDDMVIKNELRIALRKIKY